MDLRESFFLVINNNYGIILVNFFSILFIYIYVYYTLYIVTVTMDVVWNKRDDDDDRHFGKCRGLDASGILALV